MDYVKELSFLSEEYNCQFVMDGKIYTRVMDTSKKNISDLIQVQMSKFSQNQDLMIRLLQVPDKDIVSNYNGTNGMYPLSLTTTKRILLDNIQYDTLGTLSSGEVEFADGRIFVHIEDVIENFPSELTLLASACAQVDNLDLHEGTLSGISKYRMNEDDFVLALGQISDNYDPEDPDDMDMVSHWAKKLISYYLRDLNLNDASKALDYIW